ncbi:hypothetical protein GW781_06570 [bacterium]|nr:hypothetical protein [bacterium]NCT20802.1 hypothetical protein [bacterium]OIO84152.1 MAG: hypothetical protein AUK01_10320 [Anaerolineae bacterium CG2_30_57_67]
MLPTFEENAPDYLKIAEIVIEHDDWKQALDSVIAVVRSVFLFDNMALFLNEAASGGLTEVVYARAIGRGRSAEADGAWGAEVAAQVATQNHLMVKTPDSTTPRSERVLFPYYLGLPLRAPQGCIGALIFVRYGGPTYAQTQIQRAQYIATQFSSLFERKRLLELVARLKDAQHQVDLQETFIATISHELRTPLGFIKGYSTTLLRSDTKWDEPTRREFLTIIDEEADHLKELIENMLESARLQSNTLSMKFQAIRLDGLLRDVILRNQSRYKNLKVTLDAPVCPPILADGVRVTQVIENLISNAAKYAPDAPITIHLSETEGGQRILFSDQGPGIAPEHLAHIFDKFYRVPGQSGSGSGLGLYICQQIIRAHGGDLLARSSLGQGVTFIINLLTDPRNIVTGG